MTAPLPAGEAARRILAELRQQPPLRIPLDDALGGILAESVRSPLAIPPWTNSAMDGYAARADDVRGATPAAPKTLRVIEVIPAGNGAGNGQENGAEFRWTERMPVPAPLAGPLGERLLIPVGRWFLQSSLRRLARLV